MDEEKKLKIIEGVIDAFNKWCIRYDERSFRKYCVAPAEEAQKVLEERKLEDLFFKKKAALLGFLELLLKKMRDNDIFKKQRRVLIKAALESIVSEIGVSPTTLLDKPRSDFLPANDDSPSGGYTRRSIQRFIHDKYNETFFRSEKPDNNDERFYHYYSVFSGKSLPESSEYEVARQLNKDSTERVRSNEQLMQHLTLVAFTHMVMREYLVDVQEFISECMEILKTIKGDNKTVQYLLDMLGGFTQLSLRFHHNITSILSIEYFRHRKSEGKIQLLDEKVEIDYSPEEAEKTAQILKKLVPADDVWFIMHLGGSAFGLLGLHGIAYSINLESINHAGTDLSKGISAENTAVECREVMMYDQMLENSKLALDYYTKNNDLYRICICLKNVSEAEWMIGNRETALALYDEAVRKSVNLDLRRRLYVVYNIAVACSRTADKKNELKYLKAWLELLLAYSVKDDPELNEEQKLIEEQNEFERTQYVNRRIDEILGG